MRKPVAGGLFAAVLAAVVLAGCTLPPIEISTGTAPAPSATSATPTPEVSVSVSVSPGPTVYTTSPTPSDSTDAPSDEPSANETTEPPEPQKPDDFVTLSGTILLVNRDESDDGKKCGRVLDVVVDTRGDDVRGIQFVQIHDDDGIGMQRKYLKIGYQLDLKITRKNFKPVLLERGEEPFLSQDDLTACDDAANPEDDSDDVLEPFYDTWGIGGLPFDGETVSSPKALKDLEERGGQ